MSESYGAFAWAYDQALGLRFFSAAQRMLDGVLDRYPTPKRTHLDVACGTGLAGRYFRERGWKSTAVDGSLSMLTIAQTRTPRVVAGDMRALPFRARFARITCLYDSLNHMLERQDLVAAFQSIRGLMAEDSLFIFDVNHPEIYPEIWGIADPFVADGPGYHLEIATSYRKRDRLGRAMVSGWAEQNGGRTPIREQHQQRAYPEREIVSMLEEAKMRPIEIVDFDPYNEGEAIVAPTVKLFFVCKPV